STTSGRGPRPGRSARTSPCGPSSWGCCCPPTRPACATSGPRCSCSAGSSPKGPWSWTPTPTWSRSSTSRPPGRRGSRPTPPGRCSTEGLQPALLPRDPHRLGPVAHRQLLDSRGEVVADRALGEVEGLGEFGVGGAVGGGAQHLAFAIGEGVGALGEGGGG